MRNGTRRLVVMRHASAAAYGGVDDNERVLTPSGRDEAAAAGAWLATSGIVPEAALVSSAVRTRETWAAASRAAEWEATPDFRAALYSADPESALDLVRLTTEEAGTLVLIGHNPTMAALVHLLDDGAGEAEHVVRLAQGFPPATVVVLEHQGTWGDLGPGRATIVAVHQPGDGADV